MHQEKILRLSSSKCSRRVQKDDAHFRGLLFANLNVLNLSKLECLLSSPLKESAQHTFFVLASVLSKGTLLTTELVISGEKLHGSELVDTGQH